MCLLYDWQGFISILSIFFAFMGIAFVYPIKVKKRVFFPLNAFRKNGENQNLFLSIRIGNVHFHRWIRIKSCSKINTIDIMFYENWLKIRLTFFISFVFGYVFISSAIFRGQKKGQHALIVYLSLIFGVSFSGEAINSLQNVINSVST